MFKEVFIVEGIHDENRLKEIFPGIETINTNGSCISDETKRLIVDISKKRDIILFFDPDYPGQRIRSIIQGLVPNAKHAFIKRIDGISKNKKKLGVEHATDEVIKESIKHLLTPVSDPCNSDINSDLLYNLDLIGSNNSNALREKLSLRLHLGYTNGKTLLKRLRMSGIDAKALIKEVGEINENR